MKKAADKPLTVKQAQFRYQAAITAEVKELAKMQERVAALNEARAKALQALNTAIVEEENKKAKAQVQQEKQTLPSASRLVPFCPALTV